MSNDWKTSAELAKALVDYRRAADHLRRAVEKQISDAAEQVAHIYNFAGAPDAEANARGAVMLKIGGRITDHLAGISAELGAMVGVLKQAVEFMEEAEAKRRKDSAQYKV